MDISKKGKQKRTLNGIIFDSEIELKYYKDHLLPLQEKGEVTNIVVHPVFVLQKSYEKNGKKVLPIKYESDFQYEIVETGKELIIDIKGLPTQEAILKRKLFDFVYPEKNLLWICFSKIDGGWIEYDKLKKARSIRKKNKE